MSKNNQLPTNKDIAQYLNNDVPLMQLEHDLLMAELDELLAFDPLESLDFLDFEPLPEIDIAKELEQLDKLESDLFSDLEGLDDE
ncbi:hypothetical protein [Psychrobacter sp. H7-1]|uniref:hypothetical protein n=1 Tax=Psychrobacter sp. H7-1 TaxID=1569265 RepID=UPI00191AA997|nr:hypothetical protein [Psychrobacter sp. H7-1]